MRRRHMVALDPRFGVPVLAGGLRLDGARVAVVGGRCFRRVVRPPLRGSVLGPCHLLDVVGVSAQVIHTWYPEQYC